MNKQGNAAAADKKLAAAFTALEAELDTYLPAAKTAKPAREQVAASVARLRQAVGKV